MVEENKELKTPNLLLVRDGEYQTYEKQEEACVGAREKSIGFLGDIRIYEAGDEILPSQGVKSAGKTPKFNPVFVLIWRLKMYAVLEDALAKYEKEFREGKLRIFVVGRRIPWSEKEPEEKTT